jgi:hypothetical protein
VRTYYVQTLRTFSRNVDMLHLQERDLQTRLWAEIVAQSTAKAQVCFLQYESKGGVARQRVFRSASDALLFVARRICPAHNKRNRQLSTCVNNVRWSLANPSSRAERIDCVSKTAEGVAKLASIGHIRLRAKSKSRFHENVAFCVRLASLRRHS